ncbi:MAG: orotidine 5-phosphate decarboxylase [Pseudomonadota bacterium]|jgi:orotidine-5'-phosphate decarboxylase
MSGLSSAHPVFVALDTTSREKALAIANAVAPHVGGLKVGLEFISALGPDGIRAMVATGLPVFADVKFHDIPNTVAGAVRALAPLGPAIIDVHAAGGSAMMRAARDAAAETTPRAKIIAVTVLTSLDSPGLAETGVAASPLDQVVRLARLAQGAGLDGVVCSPLEIAAVRKACGPGFLIVTPGVRPAGAALGDQQRVMTPGEAISAGADFLVVGRPITGASDPAAAARAIAAECAHAALS